MKNRNVLAMASLFIAAAAFAMIGGVVSTNVYAQPLERDPIRTIVDNVTGEAEPIQMTIIPDEFLPANGTMTLSMQGMNDIDFKDTPPKGIFVIVSNDSATVTNHPVELPGATAAAAPPAVPPTAIPPPAAAPPSTTADESSTSSDEEGD